MDFSERGIIVSQQSNSSPSRVRRTVLNAISLAILNSFHSHCGAYVTICTKTKQADHHNYIWNHPVARDTAIRHQTASGRDIDRGIAENIRETPDKARLEQLLITP
jgi:hypothetical protein